MENDDKDNITGDAKSIKEKSFSYDKHHTSDNVTNDTESRNLSVPHKVKITGLLNGEFTTTKKEMKVQDISNEIGVDENTIYAIDKEIKNDNGTKKIKETKSFNSTILIDDDVELKCIKLGGES